MTQTLEKTDISHDFDFLFGEWNVENKRLKKRLQGSDDWESFGGSLRCVPLLEGLCNMDELLAPDGTPLGMAVRSFDRAAQQWSIYWVSYSDGIMQPPVVGTFVNGVGTFEGDDVYQGIPVRVRFVWSEVNSGKPHWEQFFSTDKGQTWEMNWENTFTRK